MYITLLIFAPAAAFPGVAWGANGILPLINGSPTDFTANFMVFIAAIIPPIVALIIASVLAENPKDAFGVLVISMLISCGIYALFLGIGQVSSAYIYLMWVDGIASYGYIGNIIIIFIAGIVNSFFYGAIAMFITKAGL
jgi:hypothetical protein